MAGKKNRAVTKTAVEEKTAVHTKAAVWQVFCGDRVPVDVAVLHTAEGRCSVKVDFYNTWLDLFGPHRPRFDVVCYGKNMEPLCTCSDAGTFDLNVMVHAIKIQHRPTICAHIVDYKTLAATTYHPGVRLFVRRLTAAHKYAMLTFNVVAGFQCLTCGHTTPSMAEAIAHIHDTAAPAEYGEVVCRQAGWECNRHFDVPKVRSAQSATHANYTFGHAQFEMALARNQYKSRQKEAARNGRALPPSGPSRVRR